MHFKNLKQAIQYFSNEEVCREYLIQQRWNGKPECPFCGCTKVYSIEKGKRFKCADRNCYKKFSVTVGTIYENSNLPLSTWFTAVWLITAHKKGISSHQLARDLGLTQKTAWFVLHRVREMLIAKAPQMLNGTVEIDETYVGGSNENRKKSKKIAGARGRSLKDKTPVVGVVQRNGNVVVYSVPNMKKDSITAIINKHVEKGSTMVTDEYPVYKGLKHEYNHQIVQHRLKEYVRGAHHTNTIEGFWSLLKRGIIGIYHQVSPKHLQRYCDEFAARYNTREIRDNERFELSIKNSEGRLKYKALIGKP